MSEFAILDPATPIHSRYLIEASAGTGKTFSIENLYIRLLLERDPTLQRPLRVEEIVTVTFTNAATEELKKRVQQKLIATLQETEDFAKRSIDSKTPYLAALLHPETAVEIIQLLKTALFSLDEAKIFTIHSFCYKLLKEHYYTDGAPAAILEKSETEELVDRVIQDYFRSEMPGITSAQARLLLSRFGGEEKLKKTLLDSAQTIQPIVCPLTGNALFNECQKAYKDAYLYIEPFTNEERKACIDTLLRRRKKDVRSDKSIAIGNLIQLVRQDTLLLPNFERLITDGVPFISFYSEEYAKAPAAHPCEIQLLRYLCAFAPFVLEARSVEKILATVTSEVQKLVKHHLQSTHQLTFNTLLQETEKATKKKRFLQNVRSTIKAAIIDEFQDTDPIQWNIFQRLFITPKAPPYLYLVGDPKQSIYAFRSADIYTYLQAYQVLGQDAVRTLDTNWRSSGELVNGINYLFSPKTAPDFLRLPRNELCLSCPPVKSGQGELSFSCKKRKAIHCFLHDCDRNKLNSSLFENDFFAPAVVEELHSLHAQGVEWEQIAFIVKDRSQLHEVKKWLKSRHIPYTDNAGKTGIKPYAIEELIAYAKALLTPKNAYTLKRLLASPLFGFDEEKLLSLEDSKIMEPIVQELLWQRQVAEKKGFAEALYLLLRHTPSFCECSPWERLYTYSVYEDFCEDLLFLQDTLLSILSPKDTLEQAVRALQEIQQNPPPVQTASQGGIQLITLHSSKGLEWDVVFALAHLRSSKMKDSFVTATIEGKQVLQAPEEGDAATILHQKEKDAEKARLFYVLLTRAKHRLYLPLPYNYKQEDLPGEKSMLQLWLEASGSFTDPSALLHHPSISYSTLHKACIISKKELKGNSFSASFPPLSFNTAKHTSFSSLTTALPPHLSPLEPPQESSVETKTVHTLPAGSAIGTVVHTLFEQVRFDRKNLREVIEKNVSSSPFAGWEAVFEQIVTRTLQSDLGGFTFADIDPKTIFKEVEFSCLADPVLDPNLSKEDQIKGFIDLLFLHQNRWYIVDWKSNWLGETEQEYSTGKLFEEMQKHRYFLQASIYKRALEKYLGQFPEMPQEFGGIFYLFVRGCKEHTSKGVYKL